MREGTYREAFASEEEAIAFMQGVEFTESEHLSVEYPYEEEGEWIVNVSMFP